MNIRFKGGDTMKKRRMKRLIASLLVCLMILGVIPANTGYSSYGVEAAEIDFTDSGQTGTQTEEFSEESFTSESQPGEPASEPLENGTAQNPVEEAQGDAQGGDFTSESQAGGGIPEGDTVNGTVESGGDTEIVIDDLQSGEMEGSSDAVQNGGELSSAGSGELNADGLQQNTDSAITGEPSGEEAENTENPAEEEKEIQEERITEPSDGSLAGLEMNFVNLYWEDIDLGDVYALYQGGSAEDQEILMTRGDRGKYFAAIPEGDYSRVSFVKKQENSGSGEEIFVTEEIVSSEENVTSEENFVSEETFTSGDVSVTEDPVSGAASETVSTPAACTVYGNAFQYYGGESALEGCMPVYFTPEANDTFYYDVQAPENSYWSADALYEPAANGISVMKVDPSADKAGETLYFVDIADTTYGTVKRVTMQFYYASHAEGSAPEKQVVMYEGREGIFSAPIPEGGYEEVSFHLEYDSGREYQIIRHFNFYADEGSLDGDYDYPDESFLYEAGVMDTYFYNHVGDPNYDSLTTCYWGPHPSVMDRSLDAQYLYIDVSDEDNNKVFLDPSTIQISYNGAVQNIDLRPTRDPDIYAYQFPSNCGATELTVITLTGKVGYLDENGEQIPDEELTGDQPRTENVFRFYYPYNSNKKMILADHFKDTEKHIFAEFVIEETEEYYVFLDNTTTEFDSSRIFYRLYRNGKWDQNYLSMTELTEGDYSEIFGDYQPANSNILKGLYYAKISSEAEYIQFQADGSQWRTTSEIGEDSLARIPHEEFSFPCFYAAKTAENGSQDSGVVNLSGKWMSALAVRDLAATDIPEGTFEKEANAYYGTSSFYDYYMDFELNGISLDDNTAFNNYGKMTANTMNQAISDYYNGKNVQAPIYITGDPGNKNELYKYNNNLNEWTSQANKTVTQGGVDSSLLGGEQSLAAGGTAVPLFNEEFLRGNNSYGAALGQVFQNVYFPFVKNEDGYWEFDSFKSEETLRLKNDVNHGYFLERTGEDIWAHSGDGAVTSFFPFNDSADQDQYSITNNQNVNKGDVGNDEKTHLNYLFGTRFDIPFTLPEGNVVDDGSGEKVPVTFEFDGDDDAWIFIDGQLVLDLGGIHGSMKGTINFQKKTATIEAGRTSSGQGTTSMPSRDLNGQATSSKTTFKLDETKKEHTLTMFYMERGRGSSNLKITFNFPKQNALNVTNEIDTSAADSLFQDALENLGSFSYAVKNKVTSGTEVRVEDSAGYVDHNADFTWNDLDGQSADYNPDYTQVQSVAGRWNNALQITQTGSLTSSSPDKDFNDRLVKIPISQGGTGDISSDAYLQFYAYNAGSTADRAGESVYVVLEDSSGNRIGGWANRAAYDGSSNSIGSNRWSLERVDINKLQYLGDSTSFDRKNVTYVAFALRHENSPMRIDTIQFFKTVEITPSHKFSVEQDEISDYGSVVKAAEEEYQLSDVSGAWYAHYGEGVGQSTYRMTENGSFSLGSGERAEFVDKFRAGAYLQITQEDTDSRVFDTTWSIRDGVDQEAVPENSLLPSRTDTDSIRNDGSVVSGDNYPQDAAYPLENVSGNAASDSLLDNTPNDGRVAQSTTGGSEIAKPEGGSFVYRSYDNPDDNEINPINLTVAFRNVLKTGSITITKKLNLESGQSAAGAQFQFELTFTNVAGMNLEEAPVKTVVTVTLDESGYGSTTFAGIPAGTDYTVREYKSAGFALQDITSEQGTDVNSHKGVTIERDQSSNAPLSARATTYASDQAYSFTNAVNPVEMLIEKHWDDAGYEDNRPEAIGIQIQRRTGNSTKWENVTKTFYEGALNDEDGDYIKLTKDNALEADGSVWTVTTEKLDTLSPDGQVYTYRIQEVPVQGAGDWHLGNYEAAYVQGDPDTGAYIVTNTPASINLRKVWEDGNDPSRPVSVRVKLQRRPAEDTDGQWSDYKDQNGEIIELTLSTHDTPQWSHVLDAIERVDENGKPYEYRAVEIALIYSDGHEVNIKDDMEEGTTNQYKVSYSSNDDNTVLTVTNSKGRGQVKLLKKDRADQSPLPGAVFTLERLKPRGSDAGEAEENTQFKVGEFNNELWMVDDNYTSLKLTTDEEGMIDFGNLPYGYYRVTEVEAPEGYILLDEPYDFKITEEVLEEVQKEKGENFLTLEIENRSVITLPIAGAAGTAAFTAAGVLLIAVALILYRRHLRLQRINNSHKYRKRG